MSGLSKPLTYDTANGEHNHFAACFAHHMAECVSDAVTQSGGHTKRSFANTPAAKAARWFIDHYPLLGGLAAHFRLIEDYRQCYQQEIRVAAIDIYEQVCRTGDWHLCNSKIFIDSVKCCCGSNCFGYGNMKSNFFRTDD